MIVEIRETYFRRWEGSVPTQEKKKKTYSCEIKCSIFIPLII